MKYIYNSLVLKHFFTPTHVGDLKVSTQIATSTVGSVSAGECISLQFAIEHSQVKSAKFKAYGNVFIIAGTDYVAEYCIDKSLILLQDFNHACLMQMLEIPRTKRHSALLIEQAVHSAIDHYNTTDIEANYHG